MSSDAEATAHNRTLSEFAASQDDAPQHDADGAREAGDKRVATRQITSTRTATNTSRTCLNCGNHITPEFARVFGDNDDDVHACLECADSNAELRYAASGREHPGYQPGAAIGGGDL